jgi:uncharacterized protein
MRFLLLDCSHTDNSAEKAVCTVPELRTLDLQIEQQSPALKTKLDAGNLELLADTGMPFLRERNNCSNETEIAGCVKKVLTERLNLLTRNWARPAPRPPLSG